MRNTEEVLCPFKIKHSHSLHVKRIRFNVFEHHRECGRKFKFANGRYSHKSNPNQLFFWWYNLKFFSFRPIPFVDLFCASFLFPCIFPKPPPPPPQVTRWSHYQNPDPFCNRAFSCGWKHDFQTFPWWKNPEEGIKEDQSTFLLQTYVSVTLVCSMVSHGFCRNSLWLLSTVLSTGTGKELIHL